MAIDVNQAATSQATESREPGVSVLDMASKRMVLRRKLRHFYDQSASVAIAIGGVSVILAILLIFMYLFYEVLPLFESATLERVDEYQIENRSNSRSLHLAIEEQSEIGMRIGDQADALFFDVTDGETIAFIELSLPPGTSISHFALDTEESGIFALGLDSGEALVARYGYDTDFVGENNTRILTPKIDFPFGEQPYALFPDTALTELAVRSNGDSLMVAGVDENGTVRLINATKQTNLFSAFDIGGGDADFEIENYPVDVSVQDLEQMFIGGDQRWLYFISSSGLIRALDLVAVMNGDSERFGIQTVLTENGVRPTQVVFLLGGISLLVADDSGAISQWFLSREEGPDKLAEGPRIQSWNAAYSPHDAGTAS